MRSFHIRPYQLDDVDEVYAAADESRDHVGRWMGWMTPDYCWKDAWKWVRYAVTAWDDGTAYEFVIVDTQTGAIAGSCGLNFIKWPDRVCNLGYWVRASCLGNGAAKQAAILLRDFGFQMLRLNRLEIVVAAGNQQSRRVAESVGATYEGIQRLRLSVGETPHDARMYALLNPAVSGPNPRR